RWIAALAAAALAAGGLYFFRAAPAVLPPTPTAALPDPAAAPAIAKAVAWLRTAKLPASTHMGPMPSDVLVCLALAHAGVPETDPFFAKLLEGVLAARLQRTYIVSLQAVLLEKLDRVRYQGCLHQCAQFLVDNQCVNGQWSYGS